MKSTPAGADAKYDLGMWDEASQEITSTDLMDFYADLIKDFPVVTIEDGFDEDDWPNWSEMVRAPRLTGCTLSPPRLPGCTQSPSPAGLQ